MIFSKKLNSEQKNKPGLIKTSMLVANLLSALFLLISQVSPAISPAKFWPLEVVSIAYPFILLVNIFFIVYWTMRFHRFVFISAVVIIMGYDKLTQLYRPSIFCIDIPPPVNAIKLMTFNVRLFDLYNWTGNAKTRSEIFKMLKFEKPTILCFQEYYTSDNPKNHFSNTDTVSKLLDNAYSHVEYAITHRKTDHWGLATFSKYPVVGGGRVFFKPGIGNFGMFTDLLIEKDTIRVYNVHFQSNHFKEKDYEFLENPDSGSNDRIMQGLRSILMRLKNGALKRANQVDELCVHLAACPHPYIICGDFNDPPFSYTYESVARNIKDAFVEKGKGFGLTYSGTFAPYRIDYILHHNSFETYRFDILKNKLSDHSPVVAWLSFDPEKTKAK